MNLAERIKKWRCKNEVVLASTANGIDPIEIFALIFTESNGDEYAIRFEKDYKWIHPSKKMAELWGTTEETALILQKCSFGLCQIMGSTFFDLGIRQRPTALFSYTTSIECALKIWVKITKRYGNNPMDKYAVYNSGQLIKKDGIYKNHDNVERYKKFYNELKNEENRG